MNRAGPFGGDWRKCRVCGCTDDNACAGGCYWLSPRDNLCSACKPAEPHVVNMTRSMRDGVLHSVATCQCGFVNAIPTHRGHHRRQDRAIQTHWCSVVEQARTA